MKQVASAWTLELFGGIKARAGEAGGGDAERAIERFRTQKTAAVLALLALRGRQNRESICALLWPDSAPEAARSSLSSALSALRRDLGEGAFIADRHAVALAPGAITTDVAAFDAALKQSDWARAADLYRGHFLPGFHEDPFPALAGEYEEKARAAFHSRLQVLEEGAEAEPLRALARRAALLFGDDERWFLALMRAHRMAGDVDAALRAYEALQRHARKNGEAASEEARALAKQLRRDKEKQAAQAPQVLEAPLEEEGDAPPEEVSAAALNLPAQWTRFFGREAERELLGVWLQSGEKLITLSGAGGSGKTRLAVETLREAAPAWSQGVHFVPLASLSDPELIFATIRDTLGLAVASDLPPLEQLERALRNQKCLLLLDNFEQLAERGAPLLQKLRERLPQATFLVTSRVLLRLPGEREFPVSPLPTPLPSTALVEVESSPSAALFLDRAGIKLDLANAEAIGALCRRLDGIPLALELAAARAKVLTPSQILDRLSTHPDLLKSRETGLPERHKTLRAAIEWSVDLLSPELRRFFARVSIFRGGWTLEAAEAICAPGVCEEWEALDFLEALRDHSLLLTEEGPGSTRYRLLETLREWGEAQMQDEEKEALHLRHFDFYLALAESAQDAVTLTQRGEAMECEVSNFRAALGWALDQDEPSLAARLAGALGPFWEIRSHFSEGCDWMRRAMQRADDLEPAVRARLLRGAGILFWYGGDLRQARDTLAQSVELYESMDDEAGLAHALDMLGKSQMVRSQPEEGRRNGERAVAIARRRGDIGRLASALVTEAWGMTNTRRPLESNGRIDEALAIAQRLGVPRLRAVCLGTQALNFWGAGEHERAREQCRMLLRECDLGTGIYAHSFSRGVVVIVACGIDDWELARPVLPAVTRDFFSIGTRWEFINLFYVAARFALRRHDLERAALIFAAAHARCESASYELCGCLHEFELSDDERKALSGDAWERGARLRDEDVVALIEEMCRE